MRFYVVIRYTAITFLLNALFLLGSSLIAALKSDADFFPLFYSFVITLLFGVFPLIFVPAQTNISYKEGLLIVVSGWLASCLVGTIPYVLWGGEFTFTNAWFESVSGYTTTGSSILTDIEALPMGLLFWRSATHWIGGIGIIVLALAVLPHMGLSGMILYRSEMSDLSRQNFSFSSRKSMEILLYVYFGLTAVQTVALLICGMNLFDALTTSFATIATGGFSPRNASIAYYDSVAIEIVIIVFMILSGIHFGLLFSALFGKLNEFWKSSVVRLYLFMILVGAAITTLSIYGDNFHNWGSSLRYALFQIVSVGTSTGFANTDSSLWPPLAQVVLLFFTLQCACAGSTSGGIKVDRTVIFMKSITRKIKQLQHPKAVVPIKISGKSLDDSLISFSLLYVIIYICIVFISTLILTSLGVDSLSAFSGSAATMGNVGPGLGSVGSVGNFAHIPSFGKWVLSITMLLGRLEIFGLIVCFMKSR